MVNEIGFITCMQQSSLVSNIIIALSIYSMISTMIIFILIWIIKNQFSKNSGTSNQANAGGIQVR